MLFDPNNKIISLCAEGMSAEGQGLMEKAKTLFEQAWNEAHSDFEKFIAAHYVARQQHQINDKLKWDQTALDMALKVNDIQIKESFPSLYLNIAKCYEELQETEKAREHYQLALGFLRFLPSDGYGKMIRAGVLTGIDRTKK